MTFLDFCRAHGVILDTLPTVGAWKRYKTTDKPSHRNGAVKFMGDHGFVQNHATMQEVSVWRCEGESPIAHQEIQRIAREASQEIARNNARAAERAVWTIAQCETRKHAYTASKGFPDEMVNVWKTDAGPVAVIPMWIGRNIVGAQLITEAGEKKFLPGQRSGGAEFVFANRGPHILCEGYATALSARNALKNIKRPYTLHVCFSAGNMKKIAAELEGGIVLADNDASGTGERVAREIGWPYWMSDRVGEDFNDAHQRLGLFAVSQQLGRSLREAMAVP
jgi:putative DNA primase/helicase